MPEHLRALVVILAFATVVFVLARGSARALAEFPGEFERRRNLWLALTLAAFLAHNFWLFLCLASVVLLVASARDPNKIGLVFFVLLAVPPFSSEIPGIGGIRYLFDMDYIKLICLVVLLPAFVRGVARHSLGHFSTEVPDKFFYLYVVLAAILTTRDESMTEAVRSIFVLLIASVLPYAIASRTNGGAASLRSVFASYAVGAIVLALVGVLEFSKGWLLYSTLDEALGAERGFGTYLLRGDSLRAMGTAGQAIPYGYTMAVGIMLLLGLRRFFPRKIFWYAGVGLLGLGLIASYSRGPWLGAFAGFVVFCLTGPNKWNNLAQLAFAAVVAAIVLVVTPLGEAVWYRAAGVDTGTFDYRELLLRNSLETIAKYPLFGSNDFKGTEEMQELIQGQGIIDIVNTYISVALRNGLAGLFLFVGFFVAALMGAWRRMNAATERDADAVDIGRSLLAALTCILVTIATVSSITFIPFLYYAMAGLAVAYARSGRERPPVPVSAWSLAGNPRRYADCR